MISGYERIIPLHRAKANNVTIEFFQEAINVAFHDVEATVYDDIHSDGWKDTARQCARLIDAIEFPGSNVPLRLLDVGCGTGRATDSLMRSHLGPRIGSVTFLDTSAKMVERSIQLAQKKSWKIKTTQNVGYIQDVPHGVCFDLIVTCSVLHHIPDTPSFLAKIASLLAPGGVYFELSEPHSFSIVGETVSARKRDLDAFKQARRNSISGRIAIACSRIARGVSRRWTRISAAGHPDYIDRTNMALLQRQVIKMPLTSEEIWSVTDIHDHTGGGFSTKDLGEELPGCRLAAWHTSSYFGVSRSNLPTKFQEREDQLAAQNDCDGARIYSAWKKLA